MHDLNNDSDRDIYECYRCFPDNIRDLRFGNYIDRDNVYHYCYRGVDEDIFRNEAIKTEPYFRMQQWIVDEITNNLMRLGRERSTLNGRKIADLLGDTTGVPTGLYVSDTNARNAYHEAKSVFELIGNLPLELDCFGYMPEFQYIDVNWAAISKKRAEMENGIRIKIYLKLSRSINKNGKPSGRQSITLNHVDEDKTDLLKDFTFVYGDEVCVYKFDSGKSILINAKDKKEGVKAINKLMKAVIEPMKKRVTFANLPSKSGKTPHGLSGIKASFGSFQFLDEGEDEC